MIRPLLIGLTCLLAGCAPARLPAERAILILVSIDGFRWDYLDRYQAPNIAALAARGVRSQGLIPQFPSLTFPNHYTIVTGLRVANHGIISNNMRAPDVPGAFSLSNRDVLSDPRWWGGEPIWNSVEQQGRVAAAMFWPGSETRINGRQPTYWMPFDDRLPHRERVNYILSWLEEPEGKRPAFLTLYFSEIDTVGHREGPDSAVTAAAVAGVDRYIGDLVAGVEAIGLQDRVHYILVSDHGMAQLSAERVIVLDDYLDVATVDVIDWSPMLGVSPRDGDVDRLYAALKDKHQNLAVYGKNEVPAEYALAGHSRLPAVIGIADEGWTIASRRAVQRWQEPDGHQSMGAHGYDPRLRSMHGLFVAAGPRIKSGLMVKPFENIHIYHFMCAVLGLVPANNDGDLSVTRDMLR